MTGHLDLRERVLEANREIVRAGLVILTFGNVSGIDRAAGVMAIKPSGVPYDALGPESIVLVDVESGATLEGEYRPSSDTPTHLALYRRFATVGGIVHTHSPHATAWAQARRAIPCLGTTHADHFHGPVPVTRALATDEIRGEYEACTGDALVEALDGLQLDPLDMPAALVASHGPFAWGADTVLAVENAIALEAVAAIALHTLILESAAEVIEDELLERHYLRKHGADAYYGQPFSS
jgi:L-ribulose-5-phosphate 4-epimerase